MRLIAYFAVIATPFLALRVDFPVASAAEDTTVSTPEQQSAPPDTLSGRVYPLKYFASTDLRSMIEPLLSKQGKIDVLQADHDIVVVQDYEHILKVIDRVVAKVDVQPKQVLIEATIVRVDSTKNPNTEAGSSILDRVGVNARVAGKGSATPNANTASLVLGEKPVDAAIAGVGKPAKTLGFCFIDSGATKFLHMIESTSEAKVLACPRLLVRNKQPAEIHVGGHGVDRTADQSQAASSPIAKPLGDEICLRLRPFVSSDGMIRLEMRLTHTMENTAPTGVPTTTATQVTTNVIIPDGTTIAIGGFADTEVAPDTKESSAADSTTKKELLVILTPRVWKPESNADISRSGNFAFEEQPR